MLSEMKRLKQLRGGEWHAEATYAVTQTEDSHATRFVQSC